MIPAAAVEEFLSRKLDSHLWVKRLTSKQLDEAISQLRPVPRLKVKFRKHQKACFLLGVAYPQFAFFLEMGLGKTILTLALLDYWFQTGLLHRAIIFVTSDKAFLTWEKQLRQFGVKLPMVALEGSSETKWEQLEEFGDGLVLLPYPGAVAMTAKRVKLKGKDKKKLKLDEVLVERLAAWAGALVMDESTRVGNHNSTTHKLLAKLVSEGEQVRYALTGRPFGRDPTMLWPQCKLIDGGATLGGTLGMFREAFFTQHKKEFGPKHIRKHVKDYKFDKRMEPQLSKMVQHRSITYSEDECLDLPKVVPTIEEVSLPEETRAYYKRLVEQLIAAKGNFREVKNVFLRMRQLSSGFIGLKDDETGEKAQIEFEQNPKMDRLLELLEAVPDTRKSVIFYDFTISGRNIVKRLQEELGREPIWLWSGTRDSRRELERFSNDPDCTEAVINNRLGSMSLDGLQYVANYDFYYESPVGAIDRAQAEKRIHRDGQKRRVFRYDMVVRRTMDQRILDFHAEGADLFKALIRDPAKALLG